MTQIDKMLRYDEGFREKPYYDTEGFPTIGIGKRLGPKGTPLSAYGFTVPLEVAEVWARVESRSVAAQLASNAAIAPAWRNLDETRRDALVNMAYQMGVSGLAGFRKMLAHIAAGRYAEAAKEGKASKWYTQTPERAQRVLDVLSSGTYAAYEKVW